MFSAWNITVAVEAAVAVTCIGSLSACWFVCISDKKLSSEMYEGDEDQAVPVAAVAQLQSSSDCDDQPTRESAMLEDLQPAEDDAVQPGTWHVSYVNLLMCLQCFDSVGWAAGRASGL